MLLLTSIWKSRAVGSFKSTYASGRPKENRDASRAMKDVYWSNTCSTSPKASFQEVEDGQHMHMLCVCLDAVMPNASGVGQS